MKQLFAILSLFFIVSCSSNVQDQNIKNDIKGTWNYVANDAPYGFQSGKVIFYEEDSIAKAKVDIKGFIINAENIIFEGTKVNFTILIDDQQIPLKLDFKNNKLIGTVYGSEGEISISMLKVEPLIDSWYYSAKDAPFGFQSGKVIFYEENDSIKVDVKLYGFTLSTENLVIDGKRVEFTAQVEHEEVSIKLERIENKLIGMVQASDLSSSIVMTKNGDNKKSDLDEYSYVNSKFEKSFSNDKEVNKLAKGFSENKELNYNVHTFYYGWYKNPEWDGKYSNWNHPVIPHWIDSTWNDMKPYVGGDDIGANFYPELGSYSPTNPEVISTHMKQIHDAGIGVIAVSWWGKGSHTDKSVKTLLDSAQNYNLKIAIHIEPFYNTAEEFKSQLEYISNNYSEHPAMYKLNGKPMYYLYNSFALDYKVWKSMLDKESETTIRNTSLDGVFISLWTTRFDGDFTVKSYFDGFFTYFASDGFSYGSTTSNWPHMAQFARNNNLIYIPCVGPGYSDTRVRPWNDKTFKNRENGTYYENMFKNGTDTNPDFLGITSFNEWHEGTQIEPAVPKKIKDFTYEDYGDDIAPNFYIVKTKELIDKYIIENK